ncbi:MAG: hypothetical protein FJX53_08730 [Alphaproteobacteria bacterium]|nr:hypothetical protein [Alphaproteobacteria bacterium]
MSALVPAPGALPAIYLTGADFERLSRIVDAAGDRVPGGAVLAGELRRSILVEDNDAPRPFVRLNSLVTYRDLPSGRERRVRLVVPREASIDDGRIPVLTPVGAALIGMIVGATFRWTDAGGRPRGVEILAVAEAPAG